LSHQLPDGRVERTLGVGLLPQERGARHEIVGANMVRRTVSRFEEGAPALARAHAQICGVDNANQTPTELIGQLRACEAAALAFWPARRGRGPCRTSRARSR
jgi:hypothetical protein